MKSRERALIATLLGDERSSRQLEEWLRSPAGRRETTAYRQALGGLEQVYGDLRLPAASVYYTALRAPIGRIFVAATESGLVRVSFRGSEASFAAELRRRLRKGVVRSAERLRPIADQLEAYFGGERLAFDLPIDLSIATPFQRRVLRATREVPAGKVVSYRDIARRIGQPGASRAVGQALGSNPVPIVIPCHRVVASDGGLGGYAGGLAIKKKLLALEGRAYAA